MRIKRSIRVSDEQDLSPADDYEQPLEGQAASARKVPGGGRLTNLAYVLIAFGALLLLAQTGWFDWTAVLGVLQYWPILLIAVGVDMLTSGRRRLLVYGAGALAVVVLAFTAGTGPAGASRSALTVAQELQGAHSAEVHLAPSVATLNVAGADLGQLLVSGSLGHFGSEQIRTDYSVRGGHGQFSAAVQGRGTLLWGATRSADWQLDLSTRVPLALTLDSGVGDSVLDLRRLQLQSLNVNAGVGQLTVTLPHAGSFGGYIDGGVGTIVIRVPRALPIRLRVDTGVGRVSVDDHFSRSGGEYTSPAFAATADSVDLRVNAGIGEIRVQAVD